MTKLRKFTFPILIGILLLVLAACGGDDDSDTTSQSTGSGASPTTAPMNARRPSEVSNAWLSWWLTMLTGRPKPAMTTASQPIWRRATLTLRGRHPK